MTATLKRVAVRRPGASLLTADADQWHYGTGFNRSTLVEEHDGFTSLLRRQGIEIESIDGDDRGIADAVFTYDASLVTPRGAILMSPGKALRSGEQELHREYYLSRGIPIIGEITGNATAEAGDTLWINDTTLAIGRGFRTNQAGCDQLKNLLASIDIETRQFDLPVNQGRDACLHLMSLVSLVDTQAALVCMPLLPVGLFDLLNDKGFHLISACYDEFIASGTLSTNVLATAPGKCIMVQGFNDTQRSLESAGIDVQVFAGHSLCIACEGGPTCLTRPLYRCGEI
ncbi:hypothetical protein AB833_23400 [Chromatiales bacterium (ex Bugula neritina AB1)]|nr:hypothetical protein AB833_23400 [Chromatiales bacterium (ex Bugula neritina AB1)]